MVVLGGLKFLMSEVPLYGADNATPLDRLAVLAMITVGLCIGWAALSLCR